MLLPASAPVWAAADPYRIWAEADAAAAATRDPAAISAWHGMLEIPLDVRPIRWRWMVEGFLQSRLVDKGAAVAWAIHAVSGEGDDGPWIIKPHAHFIVTARYWRHDKRLGRRHPAWIASWAQQKSLEFDWRRRCRATRDLAHAGFSIAGSWPSLAR